MVDTDVRVGTDALVCPAARIFGPLRSLNMELFHPAKN